MRLNLIVVVCLLAFAGHAAGQSRANGRLAAASGMTPVACGIPSWIRSTART